MGDGVFIAQGVALGELFVSLYLVAFYDSRCLCVVFVMVVGASLRLQAAAMTPTNPTIYTGVSQKC